MDKAKVYLGLAASWIVLVAVSVAAQLSAQTQSATGISHAPWYIGEKWTVRGWYSTGGEESGGGRPPAPFVRKGKPVEIKFEVSGVKRVRGQNCYQIEVKAPLLQNGFQERHVLYFRVDKGNLIRIVNNSVLVGGKVLDDSEDFLLDPEQPSIFHGGFMIPLDFPVPSQANIEAEEKTAVQHANEGGDERPKFGGTRVLELDSSGVERASALPRGMHLPEKMTVRQSVTRDNEHNAVVTFSRGRTAKGADAKTVFKPQIEVTQTWDPTKPWWTKAMRTEGREIKAEGELIEER